MRGNTTQIQTHCLSDVRLCVTGGSNVGKSGKWDFIFKATQHPKNATKWTLSFSANEFQILLKLSKFSAENTVKTIIAVVFNEV